MKMWVYVSDMNINGLPCLLNECKGINIHIFPLATKEKVSFRPICVYPLHIHLLRSTYFISYSKFYRLTADLTICHPNPFA